MTVLRPLLLTALAACTLAPARQPAACSQLDPKPYNPKIHVNVELFMSDYKPIKLLWMVSDRKLDQPQASGGG